MRADKGPLVLQEVAIPPLHEQMQIVKAIYSFQSKLDLVEAELNATIKMKQALMQDLLTGKVRVNIEQSQSVVA